MLAYGTIPVPLKSEVSVNEILGTGTTMFRALLTNADHKSQAFAAGTLLYHDSTTFIPLSIVHNAYESNMLGIHYHN
jgi:hypothetical protein